jgi:hypothetical protein
MLKHGQSREPLPGHFCIRVLLRENAPLKLLDLLAHTFDFKISAISYAKQLTLPLHDSYSPWVGGVSNAKDPHPH